MEMCITKTTLRVPDSYRVVIRVVIETDVDQPCRRRGSSSGYAAGAQKPKAKPPVLKSFFDKTKKEPLTPRSMAYSFMSPWNSGMYF